MVVEVLLGGGTHGVASCHVSREEEEELKMGRQWRDLLPNEQMKEKRNH